MEKTKKIWLDGKLIDWDKAKVHVLNHGLHYGSSAFEGIRCYKTERGPAVFRLGDHINRFLFSARCIGMELPFSKRRAESAVLETIKSNRIQECYIRPIAFFSYGKMGLNPSGVPVSVAIAVWPWGTYLGGESIRVKISQYRRLDPRSVAINAKISGYYSNSIFASIEARKAGADEALLLDGDGYVAEGPGENIFIVKNKKLYTPSQGAILPGITRDTVMKIAEDRRIKVIEKKISVKELMASDEVFFTGTAVEVCPVVKINGCKIGKGTAGQITLKIKEEYNKTVRGKNNKYKKWLTFI